MAIEPLAKTPGVSAPCEQRSNIAKGILRAPFYPLLIVLAIQAAASLTLRNTAFEDEALYLYAGHQIIHQMHGGPLVTSGYVYYFSGLPYLYPLLGGLLDSAGGLEGTRLFSLFCLLGTTVAAFALGTKLFGRTSAYLGAMLFAFQGTALFLGRLATFDAPCLCLIAWAAVLASHADEPRSFPRLLGCSILLALAVSTKYAGLIFVPPVLLLLGIQSKRSVGLFKAGYLTALAGLFVVLLLAGSLALLGPGVTNGVVSTTLHRTPIEPGTTDMVLNRILYLESGLFVLAALGLLLAPTAETAMKLLLLGSALLVPAYHLYSGELVALHKHITFGLFFVAPLAGRALELILQPLARFRAFLFPTTAVIVGVAVCAIGISQGQGLYHEWPDSTPLISELMAIVKPNDQILAEEPHVPQYYLLSSVRLDQWHDLYSFDYTDLGGHALSDEPAYRAAVKDGYFDVIVLQMGIGRHGQIASDIQDELQSDRRYKLMDQVECPVSWGTQNYWVWQKTRHR